MKLVHREQKKKISCVSLDNKNSLLVSFHQMEATGFISYESLYLPARYTSWMKHSNINSVLMMREYSSLDFRDQFPMGQFKLNSAAKTFFFLKKVP